MSKAPQAKYQAIIFDLDGTAIPNSPNGMPSERLIQAVDAARDRLHLIAATGRPIRYATPVLDALGLTDPCIISGGTVIIDPVTKRIIRRTLIPEPSVRAILAAFKPYPYTVNLGDHGDTGDASAGHINHHDVDTIFVAPITKPDLKTLQAIINVIPNVIMSAAPSWTTPGCYAAHITHISATKEHAIAEVLTTLGVNRAHTIGVGDGDNDLHLFAAVGHKIAMGNAGPLLKAAADEIAPSQSEDGLAQIIEKYAL